MPIQRTSSYLPGVFSVNAPGKVPEKSVKAGTEEPARPRQIQQRKEANSMKYEKPQIEVAGSAVAVVEHMGKGTSSVQDGQSTWLSAAAYEADE